MKRALLLCVVVGAALILGGCADQKNYSATTKAPALDPQGGVVGSGPGPGGGGGGGSGRSSGMGKQQP